jgi:hypothetical protein
VPVGVSELHRALHGGLERVDERVGRPHRAVGVVIGFRIHNRSCVDPLKLKLLSTVVVTTPVLPAHFPSPCSPVLRAVQSPSASNP